MRSALRAQADQRRIEPPGVVRQLEAAPFLDRAKMTTPRITAEGTIDIDHGLIVGGAAGVGKLAAGFLQGALNAPVRFNLVRTTTGQLRLNVRPEVLTSHRDADATAATATTEKAIHRYCGNERISSVQYMPSANLVAHGDNYATLFVYRRRGGVQVTIATLNTTATSWTAWTAVTLPLGATVQVAADDILSFAITKNGTGVIVPAGNWDVRSLPQAVDGAGNPEDPTLNLWGY